MEFDPLALLLSLSSWQLNVLAAFALLSGLSVSLFVVQKIDNLQSFPDTRRSKTV